MVGGGLGRLNVVVEQGSLTAFGPDGVKDGKED